MRKRIEFTDKQKAEIFVRDRAMCAFSGKSLWVLDYGACPTWDDDWVDHIKPFAKGGKSTIDNAICASSFHNSKKRDNTTDKYYLLHHGKPTKYFFNHYGIIPQDIADNIKRFKRLHRSDWYFNRAMSRLLVAVDWLRAKEEGNKLDKRDAFYYSKSSLNAMTDWRRIVEKEEVLSFEERGLTPASPSIDHELMLSTRSATTIEEVQDIAQKLLPIYMANCQALEFLSQVAANEEHIDLSEVEQNSHISPRMKNLVIENIQRLSS